MIGRLRGALTNQPMKLKKAVGPGYVLAVTLCKYAGIGVIERNALLKNRAPVLNLNIFLCVGARRSMELACR